MRPALPAARRGVRRDGPERWHGGLPGKERSGRDHRHQSVYVYEWDRVRGDLPEAEPRPRRHPHPQFLFRRNAVGSGPGLGSLHGAGEKLLGKAVRLLYVFLNNRSNAFRASSALRGAGGPPTICDGWGGGAEAPLDVPSLATVTRGAKSVQVF